MDGTIGVNSRIGTGSVFWFTIPYLEALSPATEEASEPMIDPSSRGARVLVAEDNDMIRELIEAMLTDAGHEVTLVGNGIEAIAALEANDFDVVLMDVQMPELDGITATRRIRAMSDRVRGIPIIALTAYAMLEDVERCRAAGATEHLSKPIDRKELLHVVAKWSGTRYALVIPSPPGATPKVIDVAFLEDLERRLGMGRVTMAARVFRDQLRTALDAIASTADRHRIAHETHDLVSLAGSLGCIELAARSRTLLNAATSETGDLRSLVAEVVMAGGRAVTAMQDRYPPEDRPGSLDPHPPSIKQGL